MALNAPRRSPYRLLCATALGAALAGGSLVQPAAAAAAAKHPDVITLLAGSPRFLVYELTRDPNAGTLPPTGSPYRLVARRSDGRQETFPLRNTHANLARWSVSGAMLTAVDLNASTAPPDVYWWNLASGTHGSLRLPKGQHADRYVAAYPHGALYVTAGGFLHELARNGRATTISRPFRKRPLDLTGVASHEGVVLSAARGEARFLTFATPRHVHTLRTGSHDVVWCTALSTTFTSCTTRNSGRPTDAALVSLQGGAPAAANDAAERFGRVALLGSSTLAWIHFISGSSDCTVATLRRSGNETTSTVKVMPEELFSAYGKVVALSPDAHQILSTADGSTFSTLAAAPTH